MVFSSLVHFGFPHSTCDTDQVMGVETPVPRSLVSLRLLLRVLQPSRPAASSIAAAAQMFCHDDFIFRKALILDRLKSPSNLSSKSYLELSNSMIRIVRNHSLYHLPCGSIFSPELLLLLLLLLLLHAPQCL